MKKIGFKSIIGAIVLLIVAFLYAHVGKTVSIYNRDADTSEYLNMGPIIDQKVEQSFICAEEKINAVRVKAKVFGDASGVNVHYSLTDQEQGKVVASGTASASEIDAKKFYQMSFPEVTGCKGRKYVFAVEVENSSVDGYVNFSASPGTMNNTALSIGGEKIDGTMVMRTVTNRFDLETFLVFLGFAAYIILFIKVLYKLFR